MTDEAARKPLAQRIAEAIGFDAPVNEAVIDKLEKDGVITHFEARNLWDSLAENSGLSFGEETKRA